MCTLTYSYVENKRIYILFTSETDIGRNFNKWSTSKVTVNLSNKPSINNAL